jgi:hypothetical protein
VRFLFEPIWIPLAEYGARLALALLIELRTRLKAPVRLAWLVLVFVHPLVGAFADLLLGEIRLGRWRLRRYRHVAQVIG